MCWFYNHYIVDNTHIHQKYLKITIHISTEVAQVIKWNSNVRLYCFIFLHTDQCVWKYHRAIWWPFLAYHWALRLPAWFLLLLLARSQHLGPLLKNWLPWKKGKPQRAFPELTTPACCCLSAGPRMQWALYK